MNSAWGWLVLKSERPLCFWCHIGWRNTEICICGASQMVWKCDKYWKSPIFEGKLQVFISWVKWKHVQYFFFILILFTVCFNHFLFWRYLNSSMTSFSSDRLLSFPNSNDLNSHDINFKSHAVADTGDNFYYAYEWAWEIMLRHVSSSYPNSLK